MHDLLLLFGALLVVAIASFALGFRSPDRRTTAMFRRVQKRWPNETKAYEKGVTDGYQRGVLDAPRLEDEE